MKRDELEEGFLGNYHLLNASLSRSFWQDRIFLSVGAKNLQDIQNVPFTGQSGLAHSGQGGSRSTQLGTDVLLSVELDLLIPATKKRLSRVS